MDFTKTSCPTIPEDRYRQMLACLFTQVDRKPGKSSIYTSKGGPGIGKNGIHRDFAESQNLWYVEYMCSGTPGPDLVGFMIPNREAGHAEFVPTLKFIRHEVPEGYDGVYLHIQELDKLDDAQQAILGVVLDSGMLEGIPIQENLFFGASMNRASDNCGGSDLSRQMEDRLYIDEIDAPDINEWLTWAAHNGIHGWIMGFLKWAPAHLYDFDPEKDGAFCSPRSWEKASHLMHSLGPNPPLHTVTGLVQKKCGEGPGTEFGAFINLAHELVPVSEVLKDPENAMCPNHDLGACYAMCSNLASEFAYRHRKNVPLLKEDVEAAITYIRRMDEGHAVYAFKMMQESHPDFSQVTEEFTRFKKDYAGLTF